MAWLGENWWKISMVLVAVYLVIWFIVHYIKANEMKILLKNDPDRAFETARNYYKTEFYDLNTYQQKLEQLAKEHNHKDSIIELKKVTDKTDPRYQRFLANAAKVGDLDSITEYYGIKDISIKSNKYDEITEALNKVEISSEEKEYKVSYIRGLVCFYSGKYADAIVQLEKSPESERQNTKNDRHYVLLQCYLKEKDLSKAEELCSKLEHEKYKLPADIYFGLYKLSENDSAVKYAQKYIDYPDIDKKSETYTEILYFLGSKYWIDRNANKYCIANLYLMTAAANGSKKAKEILDRNGVENILIIPAELKDRTYQFEFGYQLTSPQINFFSLQVVRAADLKCDLMADQFMGEFNDSFKSLKDVVAGAEKLYTKFLGSMITWVLMVLTHYWIDVYSPQDILDRCDAQNKDLLLHHRIPGFISQLNAIEERAEQLNIQTETAKLSRGKWVGVGYGTTIGGTIGAAMKASVAAGIMNIGSSVLHGIGDSIANAMNESEIRRLEKNLFESPDTKSEFRNAMKDACWDIANVFFSLFKEQRVMALLSLSGKIKYNGEDLSSLDKSTLDAKLYNNYQIASNYEYSYALALEQLRREFNNRNTIKMVARITSDLVSKKVLTEKAFLPILEYIEEFGLNTGVLISEMEKECHIDFGKIRSNVTAVRRIGSDNTAGSEPVSSNPKISLAKEKSRTVTDPSNEPGKTVGDDVKTVDTTQESKSGSTPAPQSHTAAKIDLSKSSARATVQIKDDVSASAQQDKPATGSNLPEDSAKTAAGSKGDVSVSERQNVSVPGNLSAAADRPESSAPVKLKKKWTAFFLCLFLGIFGAHKFYEGKIGMGILYIFSYGLLFIGIIVDLIKILKRSDEYDPMT